MSSAVSGAATEGTSPTGDDMSADSGGPDGGDFEIGDLILANNRPAIIRFKGETKFDTGIWYGVEMIDKATGKHDGSVHGHRYFQCPTNHGAFLRRSAIREYNEREKAAIAIQSIARGVSARKRARQSAARQAWDKLETSTESDFLKANRDISAAVAAEIRRRYASKDRTEVDAISGNFLSPHTALSGRAGISARRMSRRSSGGHRASISESALVDEPIPSSYRGPHLSWPITYEFCHALVRHYIHYPWMPLPRRWVWEILVMTEEYLLDAVESNIRHLTIPKDPPTSRLILCGDIHGQLNDVLFLFYKFGYPSPSNIYLFNGDVVDRGSHACEILLLLFCFNLLYPDCIYINRGNHESADMNEVYGFANECRSKYGGVVFKKFSEIFYLLPLCTIVDDRIFVVHAGLSRREGITLAHINAIDRYRPVPENPVAFQDAVMFDLLWSDPQQGAGIGRSSRGPDCVVFGPDVTDRFLARNKLEVCIRSHEVPSTGRGFEVQHQGKCVTVFSASNYCGTSTNYGGVILFQSDLSFEIQEFWAPSLDQLQEVIKESGDMADRDRAPHIDEKLKRAERRASLLSLENAADKLTGDVVDKLKRIICEKKQELWWWFWSVDESKSGRVPAHVWREGCAALLGDTLPWMFIQRELDVLEEDGYVSYERFLRRFRVEFTMRGTSERWKRDTLQQIFEAILNCDLSLREILDLFDRQKDGTMSPSDFEEFFATFCPDRFTKSQVTALLRTVVTDQLGRGELNGRIHVADFLARFEVVYRSSQEEKKYDEPWLELAFRALGRLIMKEAPDAALSRLGITDEKAAHLSPRRVPPQLTPPAAGAGQKTSDSSGGGNSLAIPPPLEAVRRRSTMMRAFTLYDKFLQADKDGDGFLSYVDFIAALGTLPLHEATQIVGFPLTERHLKKMAEAVDVHGKGRINYLEFLRAFQVIDKKRSSSMQPGNDVWEQICTTIFKHTHTLKRAFQQFDPDMVGYISPEDLSKALQTLNNVLSRTEAPLTSEQVDSLVSSLELHGDKIDYDKFLDAFVVIDTEDVTRSPASGAGGARESEKEASGTMSASNDDSDSDDSSGNDGPLPVSGVHAYPSMHEGVGGGAGIRK